MQYDFLIVAAGAQSSYYGHEEWRQWAPYPKSIDRSGKPLPGLAQVAMQGGAYAAKSIEKNQNGTGVATLRILRQGKSCRDWTRRCGRERVRGQAFRVAGVARLGVHSLVVHRPVSKQGAGVYSVGTTRPHLQSWCANDHRYGNNRLQLQQGDCGSTVSTECRDNTTRRHCAAMNKQKPIKL